MLTGTSGGLFFMTGVRLEPIGYTLGQHMSATTCMEWKWALALTPPRLFVSRDQACKQMTTTGPEHRRNVSLISPRLACDSAIWARFLAVLFGLLAKDLAEYPVHLEATLVEVVYRCSLLAHVLLSLLENFSVKLGRRLQASQISEGNGMLA
jgi:hypothetical protein